MQNTELLHSIYSGDIQKAKTLINNGFLLSENKKNDILLEASSMLSPNTLITGDREAIIKFLLEIDANVNYRKEFPVISRYSKTSKEKTPLTNAILSKCINIVKLLIENKADINIKVNHSTPLCMAIEKNHLTIHEHKKKSKEIVQYLLDNGADINLSNDNGDTPLMIAIKNDAFDIAELLIENNADLTLCNNQGKTALMMFEFSFFNRFGYVKGSDKRFEQVTNLMSILLKKIDINDCDKNGKTALIKYINVSHRLTEFLLKNGADINIKDNDGGTPLFYAIKNHSLSLNLNSYVQDLVEKGTEINVQTKDGETPLMKAVAACNPDVVEYLVKKGADVHAKDNKGQTALLKVFQNKGIGISIEGDTSESVSKIIKILLDAKADINVKGNDKNTVFMLAEKSNFINAMKILIDYGVDIQKENINLNNLFVKSLFYHDNFELADCLLDKELVDINYKDEDENTFLHLTIDYHSGNINALAIKYLIDKDNEKFINSQNKYGFSPLMLLVRDIDYKGNHIKFYQSYEEYHTQTLIPYMIEKGADINSISEKKELITPLTLAIINKKEHTYNLLMQKKVDTSRALKYLIANDLYFEQDYFEAKLDDLLPKEMTESESLLLLKSWSYFDKRIDVDKIEKCIFLLEKFKIKIEYKDKFMQIFHTSDGSNKKLETVKVELKNNLFATQVVTFEDVLKKFIDFPNTSKQLVKLLTNFTIDTPIKYTTHEWRKRIDDKYFDDFDLFLNDVSKQFNIMSDELNELSPNLYKTIEYFICSKENPNSWKSMQNLKQWVEDKKEPFDFPLSENNMTFKEIIEKFKNQIEIRGNNLQDIFLEHKNRLGREFKINISDNLKGEKFYTDVEKFQETIDEIFKEIEKYAKEQDNYRIDIELYKPEKEFIELHIIHIDSVSGRSAEDLLERIKLEEGDSVLRPKLKNLCDWHIEASYKEESFSIDCFKEQTEKIEKPKGFTHIMRFYK